MEIKIEKGEVTKQISECRGDKGLMLNERKKIKYRSYSLDGTKEIIQEKIYTLNRKDNYDTFYDCL